MTHVLLNILVLFIFLFAIWIEQQKLNDYVRNTSKEIDRLHQLLNEAKKENEKTDKK